MKPEDFNKYVMDYFDGNISDEEKAAGRKVAKGIMKYLNTTRKMFKVKKVK